MEEKVGFFVCFFCTTCIFVFVFIGDSFWPLCINLHDHLCLFKLESEFNRVCIHIELIITGTCHITHPVCKLNKLQKVQS